MIQEYNATVVKKDILSDNLCLLTVKPDFELKYFQPGQFTTLGLVIKKNGEEKLVKKAYSIASSPAQNRFLEFYITRVPGGELTPQLFELHTDDRIFMGPKITGNFTLNKIPPEKNLLMIATGTGLAPFISMIRTDLICGDQGRKFVVLHGARYSYELGFYPELSVLDRNCGNFHYIPAVSRPAEDPNWGGATGRVTQAIKTGIIEKKSGIPLTPENFNVLLCGNPDMIKDMIVYLESIGFTEGKGKEVGTIHAEKYW